jgi:hypothetical protein
MQEGNIWGNYSIQSACKEPLITLLLVILCGLVVLP